MATPHQNPTFGVFLLGDLWRDSISSRLECFHFPKDLFPQMGDDKNHGLVGGFNPSEKY